MKKNQVTKIFTAIALAASLGSTVALAHDDRDDHDRDRSCTPKQIEGTGVIISNNATILRATVPGVPPAISSTGVITQVQRDNFSTWTGFINSGATPVVSHGRILSDARVAYSWEKNASDFNPALANPAGASYGQGVAMKTSPEIFNATITDSLGNKYSGRVKVTSITLFEGSSGNSPPDVPNGLGTRSRMFYKLEGLSGSLAGATGEGESVCQVTRIDLPPLGPGVLGSDNVLHAGAHEVSVYDFVIDLPCDSRDH